MKKLIITTILTIYVLGLNAQYDPAAKTILDQVSKNVKSWTSFKIDFKATITTVEPKTEEKHNGYIWQKGDSYKLVFMDTETYNHKKKRWVYMPDVEEVNVYNITGQESSKDLLSNPQQIFNIYTKGFKYQLMEEIKDAGKTIVEVELVPENRNVEYFKIKLFIDKLQNRIDKAIYFAKDGTRVTIEAQKYEVNQTIPESAFIFDPAKFPGVTVIDMTE